VRSGIHPEYVESKVTCSCGETFVTRSTKPELRVELCSKCHPFFTGQQQRLLDVEGQVDRFYRRLQARQEFVDDIKSREAERTSPTRPIAELELGSRPTEALAKAGITNVGEVLAKLAGGEQELLDIAGFGRKSLIDMKKRMRQLGYDVPEPTT